MQVSQVTTYKCDICGRVSHEGFKHFTYAFDMRGDADFDVCVGQCASTLESMKVHNRNKLYKEIYHQAKTSTTRH